MVRQIPRTPKGFNLNLFFFVMSLAMLVSSCAERESIPVTLPDSTIVYPARDTNDISASITFSRYFGQKTGRQWGLTTVFPIREEDNVYAVVGLENRLKNLDRDLMFHLDWLSPDGQSIYLKEIILSAGDSTLALESSISSAPSVRQPGKYSLRIYLFRELIAEKYFEYRNESETEEIKADIVFFKNHDKETGLMNGVDSVFEIRKKGILRAKIDLSGLDRYKDDELPFRMEWYGPDGGSFYDKKVTVKPDEAPASITGSISITPDKRIPGEYFIRILLFDEIIAEKNFTLMPTKN